MATSIETQRRHYQKIASKYDVRYNRTNSNQLYKIEQIEREIFENGPKQSDGYDILEVGGGTGIHAAHFLAANAHRIRNFTLSDVSSAMLDEARSRLKKFPVNYLVTPAE